MPIVTTKKPTTQQILTFLPIEHLLLIYFLVFVFWAFFYPGHILMKEQFSLFLYTREFWEQYALQPGGWSVYCGNFLAQFYINQWVGALIQTLLCAVLLILSKRILEKAGARGNLLLASLFPAILLFRSNPRVSSRP